MLQTALTVIAPIESGNVERLETLLKSVGDDIEHNPHFQFRKSPSTHFSRFVILRPEKDRVPALKDYPPRLLYTSNFDGTLPEYVSELVDNFGQDLDQIWTHCKGFVPLGNGDREKFKERFLNYLREHRIRDQTFYVAYPGATVHMLQKSAQLRLILDEILDAGQLGEKYTQLRTVMDSSPTPPVPTSITSQKTPSGPARPASAAASFLDRLRSSLSTTLERIIGISPVRQSKLQVYVPTALTAKEDEVVQNQMTVIVPVKSSFLSRIILHAILRVTHYGARWFSHGSLSGIATIHFARWTIMDNGENLSFESNYDGSWEKYIDDFVDRARFGLNAIWGNCLEFPRGGCEDIEAFKKSIRDNQIPAQAFYSAYPVTTIDNMRNDLQIYEVLRLHFSQQTDVSPMQDWRTFTECLSRAGLKQFLSGSYS